MILCDNGKVRFLVFRVYEEGDSEGYVFFDFYFV